MRQESANQEISINSLQKTVEKLRAFDDIGKALTSTLDLRDILQLLMQKISILLKPSYWALYLVSENGSQLIPEIAVSGSKKKATENVHLKPDEGITGWVIQNGQGVLITNPRTDPRFKREVDSFLTHQIYSIMIVPLRFHQRTLGVIQYVSSNPYETYTDEDYSTLMGFADYLAIAIENARNFQRVQHLTISDDLTKLYNSRYLYITLDREFLRFERYREAFSLLFMDLDNLKIINDTHGHLAGSQILIEVGDLILKEARSSDIGVRYGGDEYVLVMPKTAKKEALRVAARIRARINETVFLKQMNINCRVTASFGVATVPDNAKTRDDLIQMADQAMYAVKHSTKDGIGEA